MQACDVGPSNGTFMRYLFLLLDPETIASHRGRSELQSLQALSAEECMENQVQ